MSSMKKSQSNPELFSPLTGSLEEDEEMSVKSAHKSSIRRQDSAGSFRSMTSNVSFGTIEIQVYPMVLGDNPSTRRGPSVELDWNVMSRYTIHDLDLYESLKPPPREMGEFAMSSEMRTNLLIESGHSLREIRELTKQRNLLKRKKNSSKKLSNLLKFFKN